MSHRFLRKRKKLSRSECCSAIAILAAPDSLTDENLAKRRWSGLLLESLWLKSHLCKRCLLEQDFVYTPLGLRLIKLFLPDLSLITTYPISPFLHILLPAHFVNTFVLKKICTRQQKCDETWHMEVSDALRAKIRVQRFENHGWATVHPSFKDVGVCGISEIRRSVDNTCWLFNRSRLLF